MFKKIILASSFIFMVQEVQAISIENDFFDFNTYGQVGGDFGGNFNYYYDDNTQIISKSSVKPLDESYKGNLDSAYVDRKISSKWNVRVGRLQLIDNVDYQKIGEDIKKITINDKITNYDGLNIRYKQNFDDGDLFVNNIMGRFKTSRDDDNYYDNVVGSNFVWKTPEYRIRFGHSLIEPNIKKVNNDETTHSKGMISSIEFNYFFGDFKHSNEVVKRNYYNDEKVIHSFKTNLSYSGLGNVTPYAEYVQELDQWSNGQQVVSGGFLFKVKENLNITSDCKKIYTTYSDYEDVNQNSNLNLVLNLGLTLKY